METAAPAPAPKLTQRRSILAIDNRLDKSYIVSELYDALLAAGAPDDKATAAAVPIPEQLATRSDVDDVKANLAGLDKRVARLEWAAYATLALLGKLAFFS